VGSTEKISHAKHAITEAYIAKVGGPL